MQKPLRELSRLCLEASSQAAIHRQPEAIQATELCSEPRGGLPLLQVWPSESPRGEADGQAFVFPDVQDNVNDSGIESIQVSPSPTCMGGPGSANSGNGGPSGAATSVSPAATPQQSRRPSLLHPDHARLHHYSHHHSHHHQGSDRGASGNSGLRSGYASPDRASIGEEDFERPPSPSSSTTSSLRSMPSSAVTSMHSHERRRSSRYSMFDALDLEYALLRAAARGSVGPYSLSESLHKLTFTQSLAFPALARGLASKQSHVHSKNRRADLRSGGESDMHVFVRVVTALVLVLASVLVFGVVYKFVRA
ncbi:uncharacterized protein LOC106642559 [Copidosoma floridanum]|uniref:uncharacterized protein LOC106642559 n=1 Tax=Copidosoma floridanum TaxID=29053 RepID=UPI0006C9CEA8|nr:uncharacterized protein LOC106642559 [Copidosoma floridanum]